MKPKFKRFLIASSVALAALSSSAWAQTTWNGSVDGSWASAGNWSAGIPDNLDLVTYGAGSGVGTAVANPTQTLDAPSAVLGFSVGNNAASPIVINSGTGSNALTVFGSGITLNSGTGGSFTANADLALGSNQTWTTGNTRNITANNVNLATFTLNTNIAGTGAITINGVISGSGGVTRAGGGTALLTLTGANDYTGTTTINRGVLRVSGTGVLGGATGSITDAGNIVFGSSDANGKLEYGTTAQLGAADQIRFRNTGGTAGSGGALVYTGTTNQILSKTIQCDTSIGIRLESNSVGGSLTLNGAFSQSNRPLYLGGTGLENNTLAMAFSGTGLLTKRDAGTWVLSAGNTNTGNTTVSGGTLAIRSGGGIFRGGFRGTQVLSVGSGSTLELQNWNYNESTASLGGLANNAGRIVIDGGTIRMTGTTAYGRGVTVNAGGATFEAATGTTWTFDNTGDGNIAFAYNSNPSLTFAGDGSFVFNKEFSGTGGLTKNGSGTLTIPATNTYTGATLVSAGTLFVTGSLTSNVTVSGTATVGGGGTVADISFGGGTFLDIALALGGSPNPLDSTGTISFAAAGFGIDNLVSGGIPVNWSSIADGTYTLITGSLNSANLGNFGSSNAFNIGGGRSAYFQSGSLQLVVIPEPSAALLGGIGMLLLLRRRR